VTDTARTLAAVKALFADNGAGAISAQDARDLIESIVNPVAGGGFDLPSATLSAVKYLAPVSIPTGQTPIAWTPDFAADPSVILGASGFTSVYQGQTYPAASWVDLPWGNYVSTVQAILPNSATGRLACAVVLIDDRAAIDNFDPVFGAPGYAFEQWMSPESIQLDYAPVVSGPSKEAVWSCYLRSLKPNGRTRWGLVFVNSTGGVLSASQVSWQIAPMGPA
jgi:hypothetical protein